MGRGMLWGWPPCLRGDCKRITEFAVHVTDFSACFCDNFTSRVKELTVTVSLIKKKKKMARMEYEVLVITQLSVTCSKLTIETLEKGAKFVQS